MKASDIFKANTREYFEKMVAKVDRQYRLFKDRPYRSWLFRESSSIPGAIVLTTQSGRQEFENLIFYFHIEKKAWISVSEGDVDPSSYMKIYSSSKFKGIDQIIEALAAYVYEADTKFNSKYMIKAVTKEPELQFEMSSEDEEETSAFRMS